LSLTPTASTQGRRSFGKSRRIGLLLFAALGIGLGIFLLVRMSDGGGVKSGGPLARPGESRDAVAVPVVLNAPYWWGQIYLDNKGNESVEVESLDLGQIPAGMSVLGSYAIKAGTGPSGFGEGYPPSNGQPVEGLVIPPGAVYEVIVGLKATTNGRTVIPNEIVMYKSGGQKYQTALRHAVALCAPKGSYHECPSPIG
jgi:hypothetical protein